MAEADDEVTVPAEEATAVPPRRRRRMVIGIVAFVFSIVALAWFTREDIADNIIGQFFESRGVPASYTIEQIGPSKQILTNIVIGDPARPNLTVERAEVVIYQGFGLPYIGRVRVVRPRFYGTFHNGQLSFGALDPLLFEKTKTEPTRLPVFSLNLEDARGAIETDFGPVGIKAEGHGGLSGGFSGIVAAVAPRIAGKGCLGGRISFLGKIGIANAKPKISGPVQLASLECAKQELAIREAKLDVELTGDDTLDGFDMEFGFVSGAGRYAGNALSRVKGSGTVAFRHSSLTSRYDIALHGLQSAYAVLPVLNSTGRVRANSEKGLVEWDADWTGSGVRLSNRIDSSLGAFSDAAGSTLFGPILEGVRQALRREGKSSSLALHSTVRSSANGLTLIVPQAQLRGGSGATLLSLSRVQYADQGKSLPALAGNFSTGGKGLPQITGRMERQDDGNTALRLTMADYTVGGSSLAVPELQMVRNEAGALGFSGSLVASGAVPGGEVNDLVVPLSGSWSRSAGLSFWQTCTALRFDRLALAGMEFDRQSLSLCPRQRGAIVRSDGGGTRISAMTRGVDFQGHSGDLPARVRSGPIMIDVPGRLAASNLLVTLGPTDARTLFSLKTVEAQISNGVAGRFSGADFALAAVPLDIFDGAGNWRVENGALVVAEAGLRVEDRQKPGRFEPLVAEGANLTLAAGVIDADALLQNQASGRDVMRVLIQHDLSTGTGHSDLAVSGLKFDDKLQPDMISGLALGVIANAKGAVSGAGRIDWDEAGVTSSGRFSSNSLNFAAAFGPVEGLSGTVVFTDLLGLVTAPDQRLKIAVMNPGIEVRDGVLSFDMKPGHVLDINGATWPFMDGTLRLEPTRMRLGEAEVRRYTLTVEGLDAAVFVQRLELGNIMATGHFDGSLPLVFDENGGRIEQGELVSRDPGGNVAYVGELTYKDLSAMGNFAFNALRSINYRKMRIDMNGSLTGEVITRVSFDGLSQGEGASKNFITRQVAKLPIRFNVNIRAPFFSLFSSFKSLYDPALVADPVSLGLIGGKKTVQTVQRPVSGVVQ